MLITAQDIEYMVSVENQAMGSLGTIYRPVFGTTGLGSVLTSYQPVGTTQCDVWPINRTDREHQMDNQLVSESNFYISVPVGTVLTLEDFIDIGSQSYLITFIPDGTWQTNIRLEAINQNQRLKGK